MKYYLCLLLFLCSFSYTTDPQHEGLSGVDVLGAKTQQVFVKNIGYYVEFKNNSNQEVDGIKWEANFLNNFGEVKGTSVGKCESGNLIKPIKPGSKTEDLEGTWIDGATKVQIKITDVHFN